MKLAGWLSAVIEILQTIEDRHLPAKHALADWGRAHRFAGSKDRSAIGNLVYDITRNKAALGFIMDDTSPTALTLAGAVFLWAETTDSLNESFQGDKFAPPPITQDQIAALNRDFQQTMKDAPIWVQSNIPEWLLPALTAQFGDKLIKEGSAMAKRAPIDLRVNTLKASVEKTQKSLQKHQPETTPLCDTTLRFAPVKGALKAPNLEAEAAHGKGWFEVQDQGSQLACLLTGAKPGDQILDLCAGSGGKTLALSALTENKGQIHAYDNDKQRLRPIFERLKRAGCRNVQTHEAGNELALTPLEKSMDIVLVDAPCTGSGTWRRHPDAKWRLSEKSLNERIAEQITVLDSAVKYVKPGGRLVYVTCSLLGCENQDQIAAFLTRHKSYQSVSYKEIWQTLLREEELVSANADEVNLTLTPASHGTDGFFIAILQHMA